MKDWKGKLIRARTAPPSSPFCEESDKCREMGFGGTKEKERER